MRRKKEQRRSSNSAYEDFSGDWGADPEETSDEDWDVSDEWTSGKEDRTQRKKTKKRNTVLLAKALAVLLCVLSGAAMLWTIRSDKKTMPVASAQLEYRTSPTPDTSSNNIVTSPDISLEPALEPVPDGTFRYFRSRLPVDETALYDTICAKLEAGDERIEHLYAADADQIFRMLNYVLYDHPEFFWLEKGGGYVSWTPCGNSVDGTLELSPFLDIAQRETVRKRMDSVTAKIISDFGASSDYEKARGVYEYIIDNSVYDTHYEAQSFSDIILYGKGVCAGYTALTQYLLQQLGIPAIYVTGIGKGESHAWNIVQLDGEWYQLDTTWGDPISSGGNAKQSKNFYYFCLTDSEMYLDHTPDSSYAYPKCTATACNYYVHEGRVADRYDENWVISLLRRDQGRPVEFRATSRQVFEEYKKKLVDDDRLFELMERVFGKTGKYSWTEEEHLLILSFEL